ncbi:PAS domain-containing protein [Frateuria sp. MAH-13]|uniref:histidine kinase n=1 Tax=Frateuria flava TaxID=2821489 RepID=A0ABS4DIW9_9GAMM|nr:PAS domain-containing sensor histidine kinase [Frateuria flava]MBP1472998.1 PAS domain-containing protein [Frateuria flava]
MIDFQQLYEHVPVPLMVLDRQLKYVAANRAYLDITASTFEALAGRCIFDVFPDDPSDPGRAGAQMLRNSLQHVLATGQPDTLALIPYRVPQRTAQGTQLVDRYWSATHTPLRDAQGQVAWVLQHTEDVTELHTLRRAAAVAQGSDERLVGDEHVGTRVLARARRVQRENVLLLREREHLQSLFEQAPGFVCILRGPEYVFDIANAAYRSMVGRHDLLGRPLAQALPEVIGQGFTELLDRVAASGQPYVGRAVRAMLERDGVLREFFLDFIYQPIQEADGTVSGVFVLGHDVTDRVLAHQRLLEHQERLEEQVQIRTRELADAEAALRQAQKLEAVGRLTGGIAHDFNNLLQVVSGNLQLLEGSVEGNPVARRRLANASMAVERGARLASQLLSFGRRQPLQPQAVDVARLVRGMGDMLRRVLGGAIELTTRMADGLWHAWADPAQMENALLNLAINARDAMRSEGLIVIEVRNLVIPAAAAAGELPVGNYLQLSLTDHGCGMSQEICSQAFEPFFTTKPEGLGSGLGLSMVYGFAKQSGGHVAIASTVGEGTTVTLYLPRADAPEEQQPAERVAPGVGGSETILVVEDDAQVRATVVELLGELGYDVLTAGTGEEAQAVLASAPSIDLLFTDVMMPGAVNGLALATEAKKRYPRIAVLHTSGYPREGIFGGDFLDPRVHLLGKPYTREAMARAVRQLLDEKASTEV